MATVVTDGAEVAYRVTGSGPGLVLIHGTGGDGTTTWSPLAPLLEPGRKVVVPDLRGSGQTKDSGESLALDAMVKDVLAVADDAGLDQFVHVWDLATGTELAVFKGHTGAINAVAVAPNGTTIASASADGTIQIWNAFLGQRLVTFLDQAISLSWASNGPFIAAGRNDGLVNLWVAA